MGRSVSEVAKATGEDTHGQEDEAAAAWRNGCWLMPEKWLRVRNEDGLESICR